MSRKRMLLYLGCALAVLAAALGVYAALHGVRETIGRFDTVDRACRISPDYADTVIPPNICPLNFVVQEPGDKYCVRVSGAQGEAFDVFSRSAGTVLPMKPWKRLLGANRGGTLTLDVYVKAAGRWSRFAPIPLTVADEDIDSHVVYREMPVYNLVWSNMGIYQRNLENYDQSVLLHNSTFERGCCNCHTFLKNRPDFMAVNVRRAPGGKPFGGLLIAEKDAVLKVVNTSTRFNPVPAIYLAWHPSGGAIAFSTNKINQTFHVVGDNRHSVDSWSDMGLYLIESNLVTTTPEIASPDRLESSPEWSPDGKYLYFCSAPQLPIERYREFRYDLVRIGYDIDTNTWGKLETVLSAKETGLSIAFPRFSPDGRFVLFCMSEFGNFPVYQKTADLYLMDVGTRKYWRLECSSDQSDSWHGWSSNGRWIVFSSKRPAGLMTRPYFSYVDAGGRTRKPFILPQKDPAFYESYIRVFNHPQLVQGPVRLSQRDLLRALYSPAKQQQAKLDPRLARPDTGTGATR